MNNFDDFINKNPGVVSSEMTFDGNRPFDFNSEKDVEEFAKQMVSGNNKLDPFWDNMSENLLKSIIYYVLASREKKEQTLLYCLKIVNENIGYDSEDCLLTSLMGLLPVDHPAVMYYSTIKILPEKTFKSVFDNLKEILDKKVITID